jgi:antitoxin PrlF
MTTTKRIEEDIARMMDATTGTTTITVKGQVTLPKKVRDAVGLKPGDKVEVRATASGGVYIEKPGRYEDYNARIHALAKRRLIRDDMTTDEFMKLMRGEPAEPTE